MTTATRQSPMHDALEHLHPKWGQVDGMPAVVGFAPAEQEAQRCKTLALCDVSALPRVQFKGPDSAAWLQRQGVSVPQTIYDVESLLGGGVIVRTGSAEFFLEGTPGGDAVSRLTGDGVALGAGVYRFPRGDAAMLLSGENVFEVLLQTCGYNFKEPDAPFVMTRVAGVSCSIWRQDRDGVPLFHLWCDPSFGTYLWEQLLQITREAGGDAVGMACFFPTALK